MMNKSTFWVQVFWAGIGVCEHCRFEKNALKDILGRLLGIGSALCDKITETER